MKASSDSGASKTLVPASIPPVVGTSMSSRLSLSHLLRYHRGSSSETRRRLAGLEGPSIPRFVFLGTGSDCGDGPVAGGGGEQWWSCLKCLDFGGSDSGSSGMSLMPSMSSSRGRFIGFNCHRSISRRMVRKDCEEARGRSNKCSYRWGSVVGGLRLDHHDSPARDKFHPSRRLRNDWLRRTRTWNGCHCPERCKSDTINKINDRDD